MRVFFRKGAKIGQEHIFAEGAAGPDGQMPHAELLHFFQLLFALADGVKSAFHLPVKKLPGLGQLHAPAGAQKKRGVQVLLQPGNGLADGGLTDVERPGRAGNVPAAGHCDKNMIQIQILFHSFFLSGFSVRHIHFSQNVGGKRTFYNSDSSQKIII